MLVIHDFIIMSVSDLNQDQPRYTAPTLVKLPRDPLGKPKEFYCDIYIGHTWIRNGWSLCETIWSIGSSFPSDMYEAELKGRSSLVQDLFAISGKRLGCWCSDDHNPPCHGQIIIKLWHEMHDQNMFINCPVRICKSAPAVEPLNEPKPKKRKLNPKKYRNQMTNPEGLKQNGKLFPWPKLDVSENSTTMYIDEVGRGSWCGPMYICGVILLHGFNVLGIHDSKKLKEHEREQVYENIQRNVGKTILYYIEKITNEEIDQFKLQKAWKIGVQRVVDKLQKISQEKNLPINHVILDGNVVVHDTSLPLEAVIAAELKYAGVAAASIIAKVERDRYMTEMAKKYPEFHDIFAYGKGYAYNKSHRELIMKGIFTDLHRKSFKPLAHVLKMKGANCSSK